MTNMKNTHTCSVGRVHTVGALIGFLHAQLVRLVGEVVRCPGVHVPCVINWEGGGLPLWCLNDVICHGELTVQETTIIAHAKKTFIEALKAP